MRCGPAPGWLASDATDEAEAQAGSCIASGSTERRGRPSPDWGLVTEFPPEPEDRLHHRFSQPVLKAVCPAWAVREPRISLLPVAFGILRNGASRDTDRLGHLCLPPALFQALDDETTPVERQFRVSMNH